MFDSLRQLISASSHLAIEEVAPDYPLIHVAHPAASASIALHGAHLTAWQPTGARPVIYTSPDARFMAGKEIRGGIPICWPWFNAHPTDPSMPAHGFARIRFWTLTRVAEDNAFVELEFTLNSSDETRSLFPHDFRVTLTMRIGAELSVALRTTNLSPDPITISGALHTYFAIGDLSEIAITGLEGVDYLDTVGEHAERAQEGPIHFGGEVDRVYRAAPPVRIVDRAFGGNITMESSGSRSTVVWNPFIQKAATIGDLPDDAYRDFVCIEAANAKHDVRTLLPEESHTLAMTLRV